MPPLRYYRRIFSAYLLGGKSHLTFWHETPAENPNADPGELGEYYMLFAEKADYHGAYDSAGVPQLDYHGHIGLQYNPIAIAQYGLGNYNLYRRSPDPEPPPRNSLSPPTGSASTSSQTPTAPRLEPPLRLGIPRHSPRPRGTPR